MLKEYLKLGCYQVPERPFIYNPCSSPSSFAYQGEEMIENMLKVAEIFYRRFEQLFPVETQAEIAKSQFEIMSKQYREDMAQQSDLQVVAKFFASKPDGKLNKKYFETNRKFSSLVPSSYHRTKAPRISTTGSTFHGMKKTLLIKILQELSLRKKIVFIDVDMSAAHTRVARYLLSNEESNLNKSLSDEEFWPTVIQKHKPEFLQADINLADKEIKKVLKVGLYTSMNGGNPTSEDRLVDNITNNLDSYLKESKILTVDDLLSSKLFKVVRDVLANFDLIKEVRDISLKCAFENRDQQGNKIYKSYTIDKVTPYEFESAHKGISRVLQGFEVVLLSVLVFKSLEIGTTPISLDHDGCLIMMSQKQFKDFNEDPFEFAKQVQSGLFEEFSTYLLGQSLPLEPKRCVVDGKLTEY